jgi:hypothetical protein
MAIIAKGAERLRRNQSNLGFQPDKSCRLPSLLIRDQAGCPFDETGKMPVLPVTRPYETFAQAAKIPSIAAQISGGESVPQLPDQRVEESPRRPFHPQKI